MTNHFIGIDVGTGSARAAIFDARGKMIATAKRDIELFRDGAHLAEQSSRDIWSAVCSSVREAVAQSHLRPDEIAGIGFDATCSLVVLGREGKPLAVGAHGNADRNIIVWMDHRAIDQAARINATGHPVLKYVGGTISPEMQTPKILWLKEHLPTTYDAAWQFMDLADFLTWKATGSLDRSVCTVTCKWTYLAHESRWDDTYFQAVGLGDLTEDGFKRIGTTVVPGGQALGTGLTASAASELGLNPGTAVGAGLIDAHAGGVGSLGGSRADGQATARLAYVFGTSACTMASSMEPLFIPGVWGPYFSAMIPGLWLNEGGQSGAGAAIDHLVTHHAAYQEGCDAAARCQSPLPAWLADQATRRVSTPSDAALLAGDLHVVPDFLGNRSPMADPQARGLIAGLAMDRSIDGLVSLYLAGILSIGYGLRQIIETSRQKGASIDSIAISGGAGSHPLVRQLLADCTGLPVLVQRESDPVLLGAAMLGAAASGSMLSLQAAMKAMSQPGETFLPASGVIAELHHRRYRAFEALQHTARLVRDMS
ncbi:FGGY-family carbohydrate kinase [Neorhizobium sp. AL 9.2.2]|uniref:FGGY-family carbohydrate kinase n=1 Tax=Neorhizobium sp. AL 9.2.2 TaxID=2712894 RepID=UPI001573ED7A|nr:FGGY-family carbohydrate kinase [Neorhizobium sp. AL 9.2.2]NSY19965.1 FGGY-family carbohydrate kinase [Neorhizobium sp. AL 9.2.2]